MAIRTRHDVFDCHTNIDTSFIVPASRLVSSVTGFPVQPNKAIVGKNAFAHESGIHQDGVLKSRETYEIMRAQDVGWSDNKIVLGKHSGRSALKSRLEEIGITLDNEEALNAAFSRFKDVADRKHEIFDEDLVAIASESQAALEHTRYHLISSWVCSETGETPRAKVVLNVDGEEKTGEAEGGGSVDAVFSAIKSIVKDHGTLELYSVNSISSGTDAQGEVTVRLEKGGRQVYGNGSDPDIVIASAYSYLDALNKLASDDSRSHPQHSV